MQWSVLRLIFQTSSVTPDFFYVFNLILSFSTGSQSFKKICAWEVFGRERPYYDYQLSKAGLSLVTKF